jgi:hypothetical protein
MLEKIDGWVLWLTSQFVKKFNWITGKDNFFLARVCWVVASFFFWVAAINEQSVGWAIAWAIAALGAFPLGFWAVGVREKILEEERTAGAKKNYSEFVIERVVRLWNLFVVIPHFIPLLILLRGDISIYTWGQSFLTAALYLVGVNKPPYSRSRAWEWMKGWLKAILSPLPVLRPVPAPVPVAPGGKLNR